MDVVLACRIRVSSGWIKGITEREKVSALPCDNLLLNLRSTQFPTIERRDNVNEAFRDDSRWSTILTNINADFLGQRMLRPRGL